MMDKTTLNELRDFQLKIGGEYVYLDVDNFLNHIEMEKDNPKEGEDEMALNLPKFEFFKLMLDVALGYAEEVDDKLGHLGLNKTTLPFRLALNTLIEYNILKKCK
tara:strand:+ start:219 stop:533 length:315 start_codon:yes stop_codon:yes gene_type:complete